MNRALLASVSTVLISLSAGADEHVGTLTQLEGLVQIFSHPSKTMPKEKPKDGTLALFEGEYYVVGKGKTGDSVENGNIVRTAPGAKARVVFENGDQYQVGSGTAYRVSWDAKASERAKLQAKIDLMYGKFRGVVSKEGPRKKMLLRTPTAVMGVRGTDFFVEENARTGESEFTIIRGVVDVTPIAKDTKDTKTAAPAPVEVKAGYSAVVAETAAKAEAPKPVELRPTAQDELRAIQKHSEIPPATAAAPVSKEVAAKVEGLEKKALESTLKEIREYSPELHAKLTANPGAAASLDRVNAASVEALVPAAPKLAPKRRRKPVLKDLDPEADERAYERYFKPVE